MVSMTELWMVSRQERSVSVSVFAMSRWNVLCQKRPDEWNFLTEHMVCSTHSSSFVSCRTWLFRRSRLYCWVKYAIVAELFSIAIICSLLEILPVQIEPLPMSIQVLWERKQRCLEWWRAPGGFNLDNEGDGRCRESVKKFHVSCINQMI